MIKREDIKIGGTYYLFDELDDRVVEVVLYKFNRDEKGNIESYGLASQNEDASYTCDLKQIEFLFNTFDECLEDAVNTYRNYVIKNSSKEKIGVGCYE